MTILPSIATSLRKKYNKWLFMSRRPNHSSSTDQGGGKRRSEYIAASVVNSKPQMSADDFSILQFVGSNLAFAATVFHRTKIATFARRPLFYQAQGGHRRKGQSGCRAKDGNVRFGSKADMRL
jgi:hypothetical protein